MQILGRDIIVSTTAIILLIIINIIKHKGKISCLYYALIILLTICMETIFSLTGVSPISGFHTDIRLNEINFIPFVGMANLLDGTDLLFGLVNIVGNILMFAPLGFIAPLIMDKYKKFYRTVILGFIVTMLIECSQLFLIRGTDIDDIILNVFGCILGYLGYLLFTKIMPKFNKKINESVHSSYNKGLMLTTILIPYIVIIAFGAIDTINMYNRVV